MRILPFGDRAVLAEFATQAETLAAYRVLAADPPAGVEDLVPAARTVLVRVTGALGVGAASAWLSRTLADGVDLTEETAGAEVVIRVRYDGPDLGAAADALGLSPESLVARHTGAAWTSGFVGFAPGFAYLVSPDWPFETPRRATSRPAVPPGSVGLAGAFSGVYPRASPGGWQLVGTTDAELWRLDRDPPALLPPGTRVRFEAAP